MCYLCDKPGHLFQNCKFRPNTVQKAAGLQSSWRTRTRWSKQSRKSANEEKEVNRELSPDTERKNERTNTTNTNLKRSGESDELCGCGNVCQALENLENYEEVELKCGCKAHVIAEACRTKKSEFD